MNLFPFMFEHNHNVTAKGKNVLSNEGEDKNSDSGVDEEGIFSRCG